MTRSDVTRHFWDQHFIYRVDQKLPYKARFDHDYVMEESPEGHWHYHGLLAITAEHSTHIWKENDLNPRLARDLAQSYKLFKLLRTGETVTLSQMAKALKVDPSYVSSYVSELSRVYGAKIEHTPWTREWRMTNTIDVPPGGSMGRTSAKAQPPKKKRRRARKQ
jgi:hypothetical protein